MVIGDLPGYSSLGLGSVQLPKSKAQERPPVTLDAQLDPKSPNEYRVSVTPKIIPPPERASDAKSVEKRAAQSDDPATRAFLSIANYGPTIHKIDVEV